MSRPRARRDRDLDELADLDPSMLDIVDHVLTKGVVLNGDLVLGVADIDLVYLRLSAVLCAADRVLGTASKRHRGAGHVTNAAMARRIGRPKLGPKR